MSFSSRWRACAAHEARCESRGAGPRVGGRPGSATPCSPACSSTSPSEVASLTAPRTTAAVVRSWSASTRNRVPSTSIRPRWVSTMKVPLPGATSSSAAPSTRTCRIPRTVTLAPGSEIQVDPSASSWVSVIVPVDVTGPDETRWVTISAAAAVAASPIPTATIGRRCFAIGASAPCVAISFARIRAFAMSSSFGASPPDSSSVRTLFSRMSLLSVLTMQPPRNWPTASRTCRGTRAGLVRGETWWRRSRCRARVTASRGSRHRHTCD